jgi:peptidoglycan hydrolase CwlO-like protein
VKKYLVILISFLLVGCSPKVEEEEVKEEASDEQYFTNITKLINNSDEKQQSVVNISKSVDSNVTEKIRVTTKVITVMKEKVTELKEKNEALKEQVNDANSNIGIPYRLLPILPDSQNHR